MCSYIFSTSHMVFWIAETFRLSYNSSLNLETNVPDWYIVVTLCKLFSHFCNRSNNIHWRIKMASDYCTLSWVLLFTCNKCASFSSMALIQHSFHSINHLESFKHTVLKVPKEKHKGPHAMCLLLLFNLKKIGK
jgi:hypothetical protein